MTLAYLPRLVCISLACFVVVHLLAGMLTSALAGAALRFARGLPPRLAARFLLSARLAPLALAFAAVLGLCVPSYLWFEPEPFEEAVSAACLWLATLGFAACAWALARACSAGFASLLFARRCRRCGREMGNGSASPPVSIVAGRAPLLVLTGILRPRVLISEAIVEALSPDELAVVLRHECAHRRSADNLKRLSLLVAGGFAPPLRGLRELERGWMTCAEYAADEEAVAGDARQSLALASALVRVARIGGNGATAPLAIAFLGNPGDLSARVDRLLSPTARTKPARPLRWPGRTPLVLTAAGVLLAMLQPGTFRFVQSVLERLIR